jgi:hypothetical protein
MAATPRNATKLSRAKQANGSTSKSNRSRFTAISPAAPPPPKSYRLRAVENRCPKNFPAPKKWALSSSGCRGRLTSMIRIETAATPGEVLTALAFSRPNPADRGGGARSCRALLKSHLSAAELLDRLCPSRGPRCHCSVFEGHAELLDRWLPVWAFCSSSRLLKFCFSRLYVD